MRNILQVPHLKNLWFPKCLITHHNDSKNNCREHTILACIFIYKCLFINYMCIYTYTETHTNKHIIQVLGVRGLFSSRTPVEHQVHPSFETTAVYRLSYGSAKAKT
jgi:hypothetical protein